MENIGEVYCESRDSTNVSALQKEMDGMAELLDITIRTIKRVSSELRPRILDDLGFVAAAEWQAHQFETSTGILCRLNSCPEHLDLNRDQATSLFRILLEALSNIQRHAQATRVEITLEEEGEKVVLKVRDNGKGILEEERTALQSMGLFGMHERARIMGGKIEITGAAGRGTLLTVRIPLRNHTSE
jgi:signal transduction histidine kinase